MFDKFGLIV